MRRTGVAGRQRLLVGIVRCTLRLRLVCAGTLSRRRLSRLRGGGLGLLQAVGQAGGKVATRRRHRLGHAPILDRAGIVTPLKGPAAGHGQGLEVFRIKLQRTHHEATGFAFHTLVLQHRQHIGMVGQQLRVVGRQGTRTGICLARLGEALHHRIGVGQHGPALQITLLR